MVTEKTGHLRLYTCVVTGRIFTHRGGYITGRDTRKHRRAPANVKYCPVRETANVPVPTAIGHPSKSIPPHVKNKYGGRISCVYRADR